MRYERISLCENDPEIYLEAYVAEKVGAYTRKAILVIPGGGYGAVCADREGEPIALAFIPYGYNAFVLHYSVARRRAFPAQIIEAARAIKHIKDNAEGYNIDPDELFTVGFSAGGHLTACTGTLWKHPAIYEALDMPYGYNRPKGTMLIYPVLDDHFFSFCNLLGTSEPTEEQLDQVRLDRHVDADTAPVFMMHTASDEQVDVRNVLRYALALTNAGHKFEMHVYPNAPHGIALGNAITDLGNPAWNSESIAEWVRLAAKWAEQL